MKKRTSSSTSSTSSSSSQNDDSNSNSSPSLKKEPPRRLENGNEQEDDRKPAARPTNDDSNAPTDQSMCSIASHSTAAATPLMLMTPMTTTTTNKLGDHHHQHHEPLHTIEENHSSAAISTQVAVLGGTSALSLVAFVVLLIPAQALVALVLAITSFVLLTYQLLRYMQQSYYDAINGRGIGDYLPNWMFNMLVEDSIHEQMLDPSFNLEWRHLALYVVPGLSRAQIDAYVDRLPRRHRDFLLQPGAGHVLGDEFMQLILGRERFPEVPRPVTNQSVEQGHAATAILPPPMNHNPRRLNFVPNNSNTSSAVVVADDDSTALSDYDSPTSPNRNSPERTSSRALVVSRSSSQPPPVVATTPASTPEQDNQEDIDYDGEYAVLMEAFVQGMNSMVIAPAVDLALQMMDSVASVVTSPSVSMVLVSGSMGIFSHWRGLWGRHGVRPQTTWRDTDIWSTAVLGSGVAGVLLFVRANRRSSDKKKTGKK